MYDIAIIGAGVCGAAIARELSRYEARICVIEKEEDVCCGTSKANSGIVHAGFDAVPGSQKARMNVEGNRLMGQMAEELDFPFQRIGSLVVCTDEANREGLFRLLKKGQRNGVEGLRILERKELKELEPQIADEAVAALFAPTGGIVCPFGMNIAYAENACENGVEFLFNQQVCGIEKMNSTGYRIRTEKRDGTKEELSARAVVNAAGVYADVLHNMVSGRKLHITPRRGDYCLLDKTAGTHVSHTIFALPGAMGKGILVTPTVHGNLLVGPTAVDITDREGTNTTADGLKKVKEKSALTVKNIPMRQVITSFAGLRAHEDGDDFVLGEVKDAPGFFDCAGIESPGLTSAPAIGVWMAKLLKEKMNLEEKRNFKQERKDIVHPGQLSMEERNQLIADQPSYGTIVCRCEMISEGEIVDAVRRPLGARSLDGVKRRTRAGMGRCQSGFCSPRTMEILAREWQVPVESITKSGGSSRIIRGINKDRIGEEAGR